MTNWEKWIKDNWENRARMVCNSVDFCEDCPFEADCAREGMDGVAKALDKDYNPTKEELLSERVKLLENRIHELEQALTRAEERATRAEVHCTQGKC